MLGCGNTEIIVRNIDGVLENIEIIVENIDRGVRSIESCGEY